VDTDGIVPRERPLCAHCHERSRAERSPWCAECNAMFQAKAQARLDEEWREMMQYVPYAIRHRDDSLCL
jgi:hypothetical protein